MEGFGMLVAFSLVMLFGSYVSGSLPLFMPMSKEKLHLVSVLGAGLLLGVALVVIIPEGLQTLIMAFAQAHEEEKPSAETIHDHDGGDANRSPVHGLDQVVGLSLILGFLFMLLIDQLAHSRQSRSTSSSSSSSGSISAGGDVEASSGSSSASLRRTKSGGVNWTTTLGLVVHAAADGIAMGAAAATHQTDVELIVFLAIMLHKAPAAFGLVTFLLHEGLERHRIRKHLLIFALAAPIMAVVTFILLVWNGSSDPQEKVYTLKATGIAMLFSAGTFLYVATVHVLPEVSNLGHGQGAGSAFTKCELLMLVVGSLLPLLLTLGHHH